MTATADSTPLVSVAAALAEVERWFESEEARHQSQILEVDQEIKNLETAVINLQQQLESLRRQRSELGIRVRRVGSEHIDRAHRSLYEALFQQRALLREREGVVAAAAAARREALAEKQSTGSIGALMEEYQQFKETVEPTLSALPESYRAVVLKHHQSVTDRLREHFAGMVGAPVEVDAEPVGVDVAYAVDAPDGADPVGIVVLLPIDEEVYGRWEDRPDGLCLWIACRVVQAVYETASTDFLGVEVAAGGHQGLLVVEIDLDGSGAPFVEQFEAQLAEVLASAPELAAAGVRISPRRVHIDYVMPPEPELPRESTDA